MKILTVVDNLTKGGTQRSAQGFAEGYYELNYDSRIVALYGLGHRYDEIKDYIPVWEGLTDTNCTEIKEWQPDIIHIHSHGPKEEEINKIITLKDVKTTIIETNVFSKPSPWAEKVDISFQLSKWALWIFNLRSGWKYQSSVVANPIKCNAFKRPSDSDITIFKEKNNIPTDAFVIGRIGQAYDGKWSLMLIDSFNELSKKLPNLYLLIINPPEFIVNASKNSPYSKNIIHIPRIIGDKNLALAYGAMDIMVHIAVQGESFGMVFTEAILCETPVVALSTPWGDNSQCEVVGNNKGGIIVNSAKGINNAILSIKNNGSEPFKNGKEHIKEQFDYITVAKKAIANVNGDVKKSQISTNDIVKILKDSNDKPTLLTILFLKINKDWFRQKAIYTSRYRSISQLLKSIKNRL